MGTHKRLLLSFQTDVSEATKERDGTNADDTISTNDTVPTEMTQESTLELPADTDEKTSEESVSTEHAP